MKRYAYAVLAAILLLFTMNTVTATAVKVDENSINQKKDELNEINDNIKWNKTQLDKVKREQAAVTAQITALEKDIEKKELEIEVTKQELEETQCRLEVTQNELEEATENANLHEDMMANRLRVMYMNSPTDYLQILFEAKNLNDFLDRMEIIKKILMYDNEMLDSLRSTREKIQQEKCKLEEDEKKIIEMKDQLIRQNQELQSQKQRHASLLSKLIDQQEDFEDNLEVLEQTSKQLEKKIQELLKELERQKQQQSKYTGGVLTWPVPGFYRITSPFGYRHHPISNVWKLHTGIDIGSNYSGGKQQSIYGQNFVAGAGGTVILATYYGGYGNCVIIDHGGGITSLYAHGSKILVSVGQKVKRGQPVLRVGSTGASTGPHAHFEVRKNGTPINPMDFLK